MDPTLLAPYIPQFITAAATLGAVVLTLIFTGRREERRTQQTLAFEREKLALGREEAQRSSLHDQRVEAFTKFLSVCVDLHRRTSSYARGLEEDPVDARKNILELRRKMRETGFPVVLLSPSLRDVVNHTRGLLTEPRIFKTEPIRSDWRAETNKAIGNMTRAMSEELGIAVASLEVHNQGNLNEAP